MAINNHEKFPRWPQNHPSKGLFIREPPSELVIQTERHSLPVATMYGRLPQMLENNKSSHDPKQGIPQYNEGFGCHEMQLPQKTMKNEIPSRHLNLRNVFSITTLLNLFYSTYSTQNLRFTLQFNVRYQSQVRALRYVTRSRDRAKTSSRRPRRLVGPTTGTHLLEEGRRKKPHIDVYENVTISDAHLFYQKKQ